MKAETYARSSELEETLWARTWKDTKRGWTDWRFFVAEIVFAPAIALAVGAFEALGMVVALMLGVGVYSMLRAPIKQRDEARTALAVNRESEGTSSLRVDPRLEMNALWLNVENTGPVAILQAQTTLTLVPELLSGRPFVPTSPYMAVWYSGEVAHYEVKLLPGQSARILVAFLYEGESPDSFNCLADLVYFDKGRSDFLGRIRTELPMNGADTHQIRVTISSDLATGVPKTLRYSVTSEGLFG